MVIAALASFAILLIAWILAPGERPIVPDAEPLPAGKLPAVA